MVQLTQEEGKYIRTKMVDVLRKEFVGRTLLAVKDLGGFGNISYNYDSITDMADAVQSYILHETGDDNISLDRTSLTIPILQESFAIQKRDILAARMSGRNIPSTVAVTAASKVRELEDTLLVIGNGGVSGIYNGAGSSEATSKDFGTFGNAISKVALASSVLGIAKVPPPYNLVLYSTQYNELKGSISTTGVPEMPIVKDMLEGGRIIMSLDMTAATGLLIPTPNEKYGETVWAADIATEFSETKAKNVWGQVYEAVIPVLYHTTAFCKLTNI